MTRNQIDYWNYVENSRHNKEVEKETKRANEVQQREQERAHRASEAIAREGNSINASFNQQRADETRRHNYASELATISSLENERARTTLGYYSSNIGLESAKVAAGVGYANVGLGYANLEEALRSHRMSEGINARNMLSGEKQATANLLNAQTRVGELNLNKQKWEEAQRSNILMDTASKNQGIQQSRAAIQRMQSQNVTDKINAGSNLLGVASRLFTKKK